GYVRDDRLHAPALQLADEMPLELPAVSGDLALQVLRAVLPHQLHPGGGQRGKLLVRAVLGGREDAHVVADLLSDAREVRLHARGVESPDQLNHATPAWRPAVAPSRR